MTSIDDGAALAADMRRRLDAQFASEAGIAKRRQLEEERRQRILDPKLRGIGIDVAALDEQVAEKKRIKEFYKQIDDNYNQQAVTLSKHVSYVHSEIEKSRKQRDVEQNAFRQTEQPKETRREWDLNDPKRLGKDLPPRLGDDDPRCGVASLQKFQGEDLQRQQRAAAQTQQRRRWAQQQVDERDRKKMEELEEARIYAARLEEATFRAAELQRTIDEQQKAVTTATAAFNKALAEQNEDMKLLAKHRENEKNIEEITNQMNSDFLTESHMATLHAVDASRFKPDHMKGFSPGQKQSILDTQALQREELARRREQEKQDERAWAMQQERERRVALLAERQQQRDSRHSLKQLAEERRRQAEEAAERTVLTNRIFRNEITDDFHRQFGTTIR
eukprot:TRINITY_DN4422_c0_g1_i1.p1 TRINITY_DN4422_c0_g1~~TRINITY_DN4422_c0_g1_i1.p1  ORF type:complete len:391 (+),score=115.46 TRINITY_DN4422_c0_g1_i1:129-1301(+)